MYVTLKAIKQIPWDRYKAAMKLSYITQAVCRPTLLEAAHISLCWIW